MKPVGKVISIHYRVLHLDIKYGVQFMSEGKGYYNVTVSPTGIARPNEYETWDASKRFRPSQLVAREFVAHYLKIQSTK